MDLTSPRQRKRWDALSPPKIAVLELAEDEPACMETHDSAALSHSVDPLSHPRATATHIPPLGLGRMRSSDGLVSALSARERGSACAASEHGRLPLTARPLGVTPRNAAMLGPRTDAMIRDVEFGWPARSKVAQATKGDFTAPRRSDAAARRGESHPHLLSRRAAAAPASDWAQIAPSDPHAWLQEALGCVVEIPAEGVRATLLGASEGLWAVVPQGSGAPARLLPGASLRRVAPSKGEMSRTVVGSAVGFQGEAVVISSIASLGVRKLHCCWLTHFPRSLTGEVLSVERSVAIVRGGARGGSPGARVRVLPLDTQCMVACTS